VSVSIAALLAERSEQLRTSVDELTQSHKARVLDDHGIEHNLEADPLLATVSQVRVPRTLWMGRHSRSNTSSAPVMLSAVDLLAEVDDAVGRPAGERAGWSRSRQVRAWSARMMSSASLDTVTEAAELAARWVEQARALFEPPRWLALRSVACPACGAEQITTPDRAGEDVLAPALVADLSNGSVTCCVTDCGAQWPAEHLGLLAQTLGLQTATELLALEGLRPEPCADDTRES
jgi:hypothetical protein